MDIGAIGREGVNWMHLAQDRDTCEHILCYVGPCQHDMARRRLKD
jgi:hypothetical protein